MDPKQPPKPEHMRQKIVTSDEAGLRLDRWFKRHFPLLTHGQLQKLLRTGQIRLNGKRSDSSARLEAGQTLRLPPILGQTPNALTPRATSPDRKKPMRNADKLNHIILYQDEDVVVLNKPSGLAVQGGTGLKENLDDSLMALSLDGKTRPKLVHRLDRDTSGILLIARNDFAAMKLTSSFRTKKTKKLYWALTVGVPRPTSGSVDAPLIKKGQTMAVAQDDEVDDAKEAITLYHVVESVPNTVAFVALSPITGRTHQLRVHMAHKGTPIWKDKLYGLNKEQEESLGLGAFALGRTLHLHARRLIIPHPRKGILDITAPLDPEMKKTWRCFGFSEKIDVDFDGINIEHDGGTR